MAGGLRRAIRAGGPVPAIVRRLRPPRVDRGTPADTEVASPLGEYAAVLPSAARQIVVLLVGDLDDGLRAWLAQFSDSTVHVVRSDGADDTIDPDLTGPRVHHHVAQTLDERDALLARLRRVDILVDLLPTDMQTHADTWRRLFFHVAPEGGYVVAAAPGGSAGLGTPAQWLVRLSTDGGEPPGATLRPDIDIDTLIVARNLVLARRGRVRHFRKLHDAEVAQVLPSRERRSAVHTLQTLPAGELTSRARIVSHPASEEIPWLPERMAYPPLHLRHYTGRYAVVGHMLVHSRTAILPESFRWPFEPTLRHPKITSFSADFATIDWRLRPKTTLEGAYYHLDPQYPGHFGHLLTESLAKLWGWDEAKSHLPELKVLFRAKADREPELECRLLTAYGIAAEDIVWTREPVWVGSLVGATTMWHNAPPHFAHPELRRTWDRISAGLVDPDAEGHERIFVSRRPGQTRRACRNARDVEEYFAGHGFEVVYPEELDLSGQATLFSSARVVAGFAGSAMFNVMYSRRLETMIVLSHEAYTARNEHLYASLLGGTIHYFWSPADIPLPPTLWSPKAMQSDWEFDFARNRSGLDQLLPTL